MDLMPQAPGRETRRYVLFVCSRNAGRSQIAQAFLDRDAPEDVVVQSAGTEPAHEIAPLVVEAMREAGIDLAERPPTKLTLEMQLRADWAVTLGCENACPYVASAVEAWDIPDPAGRPIGDVRAIRDGIEAHVRELLETRLDAIRTDPTSHRLRLERLLPALVREFGELKPAEEIRACADAVLHGFDGATIRTHVLTLAHRQTRECLRRDTCDRLSTSA